MTTYHYCLMLEPIEPQLNNRNQSLLHRILRVRRRQDCTILSSVSSEGRRRCEYSPGATEEAARDLNMVDGRSSRANAELKLQAFEGLGAYQDIIKPPCFDPTGLGALS